MMEERVEGFDQPPPLLQKRGRPRLGALDEAEIERYYQESITPPDRCDADWPAAAGACCGAAHPSTGPRCPRRAGRGCHRQVIRM